MPILKEDTKGVPFSMQKHLRAAAFTYVIGALTSFLSLRYIWLYSLD